MSLLKLGPKFWLLGRVCEEKFEVDVKETIMKVNWDMMQNEDKEKNKSLADIAIDHIT